MALERLQNGWLIGRKENSTMKSVPSRLRSFRYGPSIIAYQTQTQPQSSYLLTGSTTMASGSNANATIKLVPGECRSVDSRSQWSWRDVLIVVGIVNYHEKPFSREPGS
jgi:hypothetical protein